MNAYDWYSRAVLLFLLVGVHLQKYNFIANHSASLLQKEINCFRVLYFFLCATDFHSYFRYLVSSNWSCFSVSSAIFFWCQFWNRLGHTAENTTILVSLYLGRCEKETKKNPFHSCIQWIGWNCTFVSRANLWKNKTTWLDESRPIPMRLTMLPMLFDTNSNSNSFIFCFASCFWADFFCYGFDLAVQHRRKHKKLRHNKIIHARIPINIVHYLYYSPILIRWIFFLGKCANDATRTNKIYFELWERNNEAHKMPHFKCFVFIFPLPHLLLSTNYFSEQYHVSNGIKKTLKKWINRKCTGKKWWNFHRHWSKRSRHITSFAGAFRCRYEARRCLVSLNTCIIIVIIVCETCINLLLNIICIPHHIWLVIFLLYTVSKWIVSWTEMETAGRFNLLKMNEWTSRRQWAYSSRYAIEIVLNETWVFCVDPRSKYLT